ncbi:MAG: hypothetical protein NTY99_03860 [DPANN group archaeon]|nr:hypothetical protein [DPANN group archaeon]
MGIVDFLKGIFAEKPKREEKLQEQAIQISKLEAWFAEKEANIRHDTELVLKNGKSRFLNAVRMCEQSCCSLKSAQPRYPQLYAQNTVVAEGNRAAFITATENLLKSLKFPDSPDDFSDFIQNSNSALGSFMSSSNRSFMIANEFFTEQTSFVKKCLQDMDGVLQELGKHYQENKFAELSKAKEKIAKLMQKIKQMQQLETELKDVETKLKDVTELTTKAKQNLSEHLQSPVFLEKQKLEADLRDVQAKSKLQSNEIHDIFSALDAPLRKIVWDNPHHKKLIEHYAADLVSAISQDTDFKFGAVLTKLKTEIETGRVCAKDKRRSQALSAINMLTKTYLQDWLSRHDKLKDEEASLQEQIRNSEASSKESALNADIQKLEREKENLDKSQATLVRSQKRIDLDEETKETGANLSLLLGSQIKLINS